MTNAGDLGYFTIPVADLERGKIFYSGLFGWRFDPEHGTDRYAHIGNTTPAGGLYVDTAPSPQVWFRVEDIQVAAARVRANSAATPTNPHRVPLDGAPHAATTRARTSTSGSRHPASNAVFGLGDDGVAGRLRPSEMPLKVVDLDLQGLAHRAGAPGAAERAVQPVGLGVQTKAGGAC